MADQPNDDHNPRTRRNHFEPLPLEARRRLWDQIWNRLLAPPGEFEDQTRSKVTPEVTEEAASDVAA
jgi:hypothetical protein